MPFSGLTSFGTAFLSKFECSQMPHPVCITSCFQMKTGFVFSYTVLLIIDDPFIFVEAAGARNIC